MKGNFQLRILTYAVIAYMLLAFSWWTVLLFQKNQDAYRAKVELAQLVSAAQGGAASVKEFRNSGAFRELTDNYKRQEWMILGESIVFVISLVIGVWLINRGYNRAIFAEQQRRNFLLSITHELKSPLASIRLTLETFLKRNLKKEHQDKLSVNALKESERLNTLVNDLLMAAKLESSYQPVPEELSFTHIVLETVDKLEQKYPNSSFDIKGEEQALKIKADHLGMQSVIINLLENAVKYSFDEPNIEVELKESDQNIQFIVKDTGIGITDQEKKKVFERFYRIGNEDTRQTKGTGLGLYIVHEVIMAHKGKISIKNNHPKGSVFKVELPK